MKPQKGSEVIELKSTLKGMTGGLVARTSWLLALLLVLKFAIFSRADVIMAKYRVTSFWAYYNLENAPRYSDDDSSMFLLSLFGGVLFVIIFIMLCEFLCSVYGTMAVNQIFVKEGKILATEYSFPFKMAVREIRFDRIIRIDVCQNSFGRMFNAGDLSLTLVTYTNADSSETDWNIPYIIDPDSARLDIMSAMPAHTGLSVKVT